MHRRKNRDEDIQIKIGGWDGRFVTDRNAPPIIRHHKNDSNTYDQQDSRAQPQSSKAAAPKYATGNKFFGYHAEHEKLPVVWDGTFVGPQYRAKGDRNQSNSDKFFAYNTETTVLPTQWSGKFQLDPNDVRIKPERNNSDYLDYADERNFITAEERAALDREIAESKARGDDVVWSNDRNFGKTGWNGKFQLDPNDVRIKPERNQSDCRDFADARNFYERSQ